MIQPYSSRKWPILIKIIQESFWITAARLRVSRILPTQFCDKLLDRNLLEAIKSINLAKQNQGSGIVGIKISALMNIKLLRKLSKLNQRIKAIPSDKPEPAKTLVLRLLAGRNCQQEEINAFCKSILGLESAQQQISRYEWLAKVKPYYFNQHIKNNDALLQAAFVLSKDQLAQLEAFKKRYQILLGQIRDEKCKVLIDAQQTYINDGISIITSELQQALNTKQSIIFTTIQNYLLQAPNLIQEQIQIKKILGLKLAVKIVKGAYIFKEIDLAKAQNRPSPICPTFQATSLNYNNSLRRLIGIPDSSVLVATHNFQSVELALALIKQRATSSQNVIIAQLKGIADTLTYQLSKNQKIRVFKYLPYAQPQKMQAYLVRRSQEVGSAKYPTQQKISLLKDELKKRMYLS